jgi:hypothetical protein
MISADDAADLAARLARVDWSWTVSDLGEFLAATGLSRPDGHAAEDMFLTVVHPDLPGVEGYALAEPGTGEVSEVALTLADVDEAAAPAAYADYETALTARLGPATERPKPTRARWRLSSTVLELRNLDVAIGLASKRPEGPPQAPGEFHAWHELGSNLGTVLGTLGDLDFVSFSVGGVVVLTASRAGNDLWLVASGPDNQVEPVPLAPEQVRVLEGAGFLAPLHEAAERGSQRDNWWLRVPVPARPEELKAVGDRIVTALRDGYRADRPAAIEWYAMDLGPATTRALDASALTRSEQM